MLQRKLFLLLMTSLLSISASASTCLYVSSYHPGYEWNDGIEVGIENELKGVCHLDKYYMDTKRNVSKEFAENAAIQAKKHIERTNPDVVIACDDNASKYLIKPYFKDVKRPFVFCGINWTAKEYGYPYSNVTGMIEIAPIRPLLKVITKIVGNVRHGVYLSADVLTEHKDFERYRLKYEAENVELKGRFVKTKEEWKHEFLKAQSAEFIILNNNSGINDWDKEDVKSFIQKNSRALTVTNYDWMMPYTMVAMTKIPQEQGEWAGKVASAILQGEKPIDIPIVVNRRWNIYVNGELLDKTSYKIPSSISNKAVYRDY